MCEKWVTVFKVKVTVTEFTFIQWNHDYFYYMFWTNDFWVTSIKNISWSVLWKGCFAVFKAKVTRFWTSVNVCPDNISDRSDLYGDASSSAIVSFRSIILLWPRSKPHIVSTQSSSILNTLTPPECVCLLLLFFLLLFFFIFFFWGGGGGRDLAPSNLFSSSVLFVLFFIFTSCQPGRLQYSTKELCFLLGRLNSMSSSSQALRPAKTEETVSHSRTTPSEAICVPRCLLCQQLCGTVTKTESGQPAVETWSKGPSSCEVAVLFRALYKYVTYLGVPLDQILSMKQHTSSLCRTTFLALRRIASIRPVLSNSSTEKFVACMITSRLDNATFAGVADEQIARVQKDPEQHRAAYLEKIEARSCHTAFERTPLAPSKIPHSVQAHNARFPSLWRHSFTISVFFSLHISNYPFVLRQKDCSKFQRQTWKPSVGVLLVTLLRLPGTRCRPTWELLPPSKVSKLS